MCLGQGSGDGEEGEDGKRHRGAAEGHTSVAGPALASRAMGTMAVRLSLAWTWRTRRELIGRDVSWYGVLCACDVALQLRGSSEPRSLTLNGPCMSITVTSE